MFVFSFFLFFLLPPSHLHVPLASDTTVPQLRISLKTFDKSGAPQGISRDSLNPQLGQTDCQRGLTDPGAVCLRGLQRRGGTISLSRNGDLIVLTRTHALAASPLPPLLPRRLNKQIMCICCCGCCCGVAARNMGGKKNQNTGSILDQPPHTSPLGTEFTGTLSTCSQPTESKTNPPQES